MNTKFRSLEQKLAPPSRKSQVTFTQRPALDCDSIRGRMEAGGFGRGRCISQ